MLAVRATSLFSVELGRWALNHAQKFPNSTEGIRCGFDRFALEFAVNAQVGLPLAQGQRGSRVILAVWGSCSSLRSAQ